MALEDVAWILIQTRLHDAKQHEPANKDYKTAKFHPM